MDRCWLRGQTGDALHAVLCAAGYNIRWLLRAMVRLGLKGLYLRLLALVDLVVSASRELAWQANNEEMRMAGAVR